MVQAHEASGADMVTVAVRRVNIGARGTSAPQREDWRPACYDVADTGHLPPHRDNVNTHTAHRRFTVSITLNGGAFTGGNLVFREYSEHAYDVETGSAVIFSASVLHEVTPVTSGRRMALLTHLFGETSPARRWS